MVNPRREVAFPWGEGTVVSRPTMAKVAAVETRHGPLPTLLEDIRLGRMSMTQQLIPIVTIVLRGAEGVPAKDAQIMETIWDEGPAKFVSPLLDWIIAAYSTDAPPQDAPAGN
jgi:hypothetical protein